MKLNTEKIKQILRERILTQSWLADEMGVHRQWVSQILTERTNGMTLKTIDNIANALNVQAKDLISDDGLDIQSN